MQKISILSLLLILGILACTKDSKEGLSNNCNLSSVSYADDVQGIFNNSCAFSGCHSSSFPASGIDLSNYSGSNAVSTTLLLNSIKHQGAASPMPQGASKLSDCNIDKIETWINDGKPNN